MRYFLIAVVCVFAMSAAAQQAPEPNPELQACTSKLFETVTRELEIRKEAFSLSAEVTKLKAELAKLQKPKK